MTKLIASLLCDSPEEALPVANRALAAGADMVEIRLDGWTRDDESIAPLVKALPTERWIATCRPVAEGGHFRGGTDQRVSRLLEAGTAGCGYIDFEFADWQRSANIRQKIQLAVAYRSATNAVDSPVQPRLILSSHDFARMPADPAALLADMAQQRDVAAVKLAWNARDVRDNLTAFDLLRGAAVPAIVICMGESGLPSRVLARKFGAFATYCAPTPDTPTAPGQITLDQMVRDYRWSSIDEGTQLYGVIGSPVAHSMSPALFNAAFQHAGINAVYLPLLVDPTDDVLSGFLDGCRQRPWMDVGGFSVTVPHKEAAARYVGEHIEPLAARIGAVNTLVPTDDGYRGYNTDYAGALNAITEALACECNDLADLTVDVLGAGGVARAIVVGLRDCGARVTIFNRTAERAQSLAGEFGCDAQPWDARSAGTAQLVINCTSVGMWPDTEANPLPPERLDAGSAVFDTVYNPVRTRLLRDAAAAGCQTIDGLSMFVNQAAAQFELWTGKRADRAAHRRIVEAAI